MITLICGIIRDYHDPDVTLFFAEHQDESLDVLTAIKAAFRDWYRTPEGRAYVAANGANWGDAAEIPALHLNAHGLTRYSPAFSCHHGPLGPPHTWSFDPALHSPGFSHRLVVDHDNHLLPDSEDDDT